MWTAEKTGTEEELGGSNVIKAFSITDIGKIRKQNQDYVFASEEPVGNLPNLFLVADGMGGHNAGDYASRHAVERIREEILHSFEKSPARMLDKGIRSANAFLWKQAAEEEALSGMGTTLVAAVCVGDKYLEVANVGDSRLYVIDNDRIEQITIDHSYVEELVRRGGIDRESAKSHPNKNAITRAVGAEEEVEIDFFSVELEPGEIVLMCSDGLTNMLDDEEIHMILGSRDGLQEKAEALVRAANDNGGKDNITVIIIEPFSQDFAYSDCEAGDSKR